MSIRNMTDCWGPDFPGSPTERLVALAVADATDEWFNTTPSFYEAIAAKIGLTAQEVEDVVERLIKGSFLERADMGRSITVWWPEPS